MGQKNYPDVLSTARVLSLILALAFGIAIIISYLKTKFSPWLLVLGIFIDFIIFIGFYLNYKNKVMITPEGHVSIYGKNIGKSPNESYYTYSGEAILNVQFNLKEIKKVYLPSIPEIKEAHLLEKYFVSNYKKVICIEFENPLKYKPTSSPLSIGKFSDIKRVYVSVANPKKLLDDINNFNKN